RAQGLAGARRRDDGRVDHRVRRGGGRTQAHRPQMGDYALLSRFRDGVAGRGDQAARGEGRRARERSGAAGPALGLAFLRSAGFFSGHDRSRAVFTAAFVFHGALKGRSASGIVSLIVFLACTASFFLFAPAVHTTTDYVRQSYRSFNGLNAELIK